MNIGYGLAALDSYYKEGDARVQRERQTQRYDVERKKAEAELSTLGDRTEADRTGAQLRAKQNNANMGLVDAQTQNAKDRLTLEQGDLQGKLERQPAEQAAASNKAEIAKTLSEFEVQDLPRVIAEKKRAGVFSEVDAGTTAIAKLADLIKTGDSNQVITFMNAMNDINDTGKRKAPVATVGITTDEKTGEKVFVANDASGQPVMRLSQSQMQRIRDSLGKTEYKTVNAGDSVVALKDGKATPVYTAPESDKSKAAKQGPLERDVNYLTSAHGMSKDQALAHLNSAKTMSREQFILKSVQDSIAMGNKPTEADTQNFGAIYDSARRASSPGLSNAPGQQSNTSPAPTMDPQIRSLLGLP